MITSAAIAALRVLLVHFNRILTDSYFLILKVADKVDILDELELKSSIGRTWMYYECLFLGEQVKFRAWKYPRKCSLG